MSTETNNTNTDYVIDVDNETHNNETHNNDARYEEDLKDILLFIVNAVSYIVAVVNPILGLIYGILMLVPANPFKEVNTTWGITLIVLSVTTINSIVSYCVVFILMKIILSPVYVICLVYKRRN